MRQIKNLPSYYLAALDKLTDLVKEEKAKAEAKAEADEIKALEARLKALKAKKKSK